MNWLLCCNIFGYPLRQNDTQIERIWSRYRKCIWWKYQKGKKDTTRQKKEIWKMIVNHFCKKRKFFFWLIILFCNSEVKVYFSNLPPPEISVWYWIQLSKEIFASKRQDCKYSKPFENMKKMILCVRIIIQNINTVF